MRTAMVESIWGVLLLGLGIALCRTPLFDLLGFEFAFALALPATLAAAHLGVLSIARAFWWAPAYHLSAALAARAALARFLDGKSVRPRLRRPRRRVLAVACAFAATALLLHAGRARLGFELDAEDIARALAGRRET